MTFELSHCFPITNQPQGNNSSSTAYNISLFEIWEQKTRWVYSYNIQSEIWEQKTRWVYSYNIQCNVIMFKYTYIWCVCVCIHIADCQYWLWLLVISSIHYEVHTCCQCSEITEWVTLAFITSSLWPVLTSHCIIICTQTKLSQHGSTVYTLCKYNYIMTLQTLCNLSCITGTG